MTKKEQRKEINKAVYEFAATMGYQALDEGEGGRITFAKPGTQNWRDTIEYHLSRHNACIVDSASDGVRLDCELINLYAQYTQKSVAMEAL